MDGKQLQLVKTEGTIFHGELYKGVGWGGTSFTLLPPYNNNSEVWGGFEYEYPDEITDWSKVYSFVQFVMQSSNSWFYNDYANRFDLKNAVHYFIFLNLLRAEDNSGKNIYLAKYDNDRPYFYVPWDLDGTLGLIWNGSRRNITNDIRSNGFYNRLLSDNRPGGFVDVLKKSWAQLRTSVITVDSIMNVIHHYHNYLNKNGVYEREVMAWPDYKYDVSSIEYTKTWLTNRIAFLDNVFAQPGLSLATLPDNSPTTDAPFYPNPANNTIYIKTPSDIATVEIINLLGQVVWCETEITSNPLDISSLPTGSYIIVFKTVDGTQVSNRLVVLD